MTRTQDDELRTTASRETEVGDDGKKCVPETFGDMHTTKAWADLGGPSHRVKSRSEAGRKPRSSTVVYRDSVWFVIAQCKKHIKK